MTNQKEMILESLKRGEKLTQLEALAKFGCFRLGARIWDLRQEGYDIESRNIKLPNGKRITQYSLNNRSN